MKRRLIIHLPIFFLIGVVLSYAVAWTCTIWGDWTCQPSRINDSNYYANTYTYRLEYSNASMATRLYGYSTIGSESLEEFPFEGHFRWGRSFSRMEQCGTAQSLTSEDDGSTYVKSDFPFAVQQLLSPSLDSSTEVTLSGWPMPCVRSHYGSLGVFGGIELYRFYYGDGVSDVRSISRQLPFLARVTLPYHPLLVNLLINSTLYGLLAYGLFLIPGPLKRCHRKRRGLCSQCKYDLRGDHESGCPECGWGRQLDAVEVSET